MKYLPYMTSKKDQLMLRRLQTWPSARLLLTLIHLPIYPITNCEIMTTFFITSYYL